MHKDQQADGSILGGGIPVPRTIMPSSFDSLPASLKTNLQHNGSFSWCVKGCGENGQMRSEPQRVCSEIDFIFKENSVVYLSVVFFKMPQSASQ